MFKSPIKAILDEALYEELILWRRVVILMSQVSSSKTSFSRSSEHGAPGTRYPHTSPGGSRPATKPWNSVLMRLMMSAEYLLHHSHCSLPTSSQPEENQVGVDRIQHFIIIHLKQKCREPWNGNLILDMKRLNRAPGREMTWKYLRLPVLSIWQHKRVLNLTSLQDLEILSKDPAAPDPSGILPVINIAPN